MSDVPYKYHDITLTLKFLLLAKKELYVRKNKICYFEQSTGPAMWQAVHFLGCFEALVIHLSKILSQS